MGKVPLLRNYLGKVYPVGNAYMGPTKRDKGIYLQQCIGDIISSGEGTPQKEFKSCKFSGVYTIHPWKRKIIFQAIIFRFYANLRGCIAWNLLSTSMTWNISGRVRDLKLNNLPSIATIASWEGGVVSPMSRFRKNSKDFEINITEKLTSDGDLQGVPFSNSRHGRFVRTEWWNIFLKSHNQISIFQKLLFQNSSFQFKDSPQKMKAPLSFRSSSLPPKIPKSCHRKIPSSYLSMKSTHQLPPKQLRRCQKTLTKGGKCFTLNVSDSFFLQKCFKNKMLRTTNVPASCCFKISSIKNMLICFWW